MKKEFDLFIKNIKNDNKREYLINYYKKNLNKEDKFKFDDLVIFLSDKVL